jgi:hypothetical protein
MIDHGSYASGELCCLGRPRGLGRAADLTPQSGDALPNRDLDLPAVQTALGRELATHRSDDSHVVER